MNGVPGGTARDLYRWAWLLLAALALLGFAHATRYAPQVTSAGATVAVWDRWRHRMCWMGLEEGPSDPLQALRQGRAPGLHFYADCFYLPRATGVATPISGAH